MPARKLRNLLTVTIIAFSTEVWAQDANPPLFAAFKTFCSDAGANPDQVRLAVEIAGGKPHNPPGGSTTFPWPMTVTSWDIDVQGHKMILSVGAAHPPRGPQMVGNATDCIISSFSNEDASIEALRKWVGVPPDPEMSSTTVTLYNFRQDGAVRSPIVVNDADRAANDDGRAWQLAILGNSIQLTHTLAATPKNPN